MSRQKRIEFLANFKAGRAVGLNRRGNVCKPQETLLTIIFIREFLNHRLKRKSNSKHNRRFPKKTAKLKGHLNYVSYKTQCTL